MLAQALEVAHLEAVRLEERHHRAHLVQFAVGKDVALDKGAADLRRSSQPQGDLHLSSGLAEFGGVGVRVEGDRAPDRVVEEAPARSEQVEELLGVGGERSSPDVLGHADRADGVEGAVGDVAEILDPELDEVRDARGAGPLSGVALLGLGQRHADDPRAVGRRGVDRHRPPATADVEEAHAGSELQLARHEIDLASLRVFEAVVGRREHGARVGHRRTEHHLVKKVRHVVVMRDRLAVARTTVQGAALLGLDRGRRQRLHRVESDDREQ